MRSDVHYQLSDQERKVISEPARNGAQFDRPEMLCRTGDGHAIGTTTWDLVTCPRCIETAKSWRPYRGA